ncbi:MAG: alpha-L-arabinofuranosidase C-terminal domain-containing protein [Thermoguttaceae bacterium]
MMRPVALVSFLVICLGNSMAWAEDVTLTLHPDRVLNGVDEKVYGHFLEHIYHSCNGGLWGELVWNRSFEGGGAGATWSQANDCIAQEGGAADVRLLFGSPQWTDYEFTVEASKTGGEEGFLILVRALNKQEFYWANLGGWGNAGHALERGVKGGGRWGVVSRRRDGRIEEGRWYRIRARCEGPHIQVWLDDEPVIDYTDDGKGPARGKAGVGTWATQARFRNFKVVSLDGKVLHEGLPPIPAAAAGLAPAWSTMGAAKVSASGDNPLNGVWCRKIETQGSFGGLQQQPMRIVAGEVYRGSLWARGDGSETLSVRLLDGEKVLAQQALGSPSAEWKELPIELKAAGSTDAAVLQVGVEGTGAVWLDQVSLMPQSWRQAGGYRPDLLQAIADLRPPVIRWPGGCYASPYRWKDGVGPQHKRGPHPQNMWDDKEVNSFGTDEFIAMCRRVGAEPLIVVNIGTPQWNREVLGNDFLQEVADWIQYCNGSADSKWGKVRAANGHPEPYGVKYWEIDNETWHMGAETYAEWVNRFARAMRTADPSITLAACGSAGYGEEGNGLAWNRVLIEQCAANIDYLSIHHYENPDRFAEGPTAYEEFFGKTAQLIKVSKNPKLKIYVSEWNAQSTDWRTGLYCGGLLNAFERSGEAVEMAGPALFLRHVSASAWDNAFVNFDHRTWFPAPNYVVMKLWHDHYAPERIAVEGEAGRLSVVATRSADGKKAIFKAVNPTSEPVVVTLKLGNGTLGEARFELVAPGDLNARNTLEAKDTVQPKEAPLEKDGQTLRLTLPPISCGVVEMGCE